MPANILYLILGRDYKCGGLKTLSAFLDKPINKDKLSVGEA